MNKETEREAEGRHREVLLIYNKIYLIQYELHLISVILCKQCCGVHNMLFYPN
jgi:hypothetical protein